MLKISKLLVLAALFLIAQAASSQTISSVKLTSSSRSFFPNTLSLSAGIKIKTTTFIAGLSYAKHRNSPFSNFAFKSDFRLGGMLGVVLVDKPVSPKLNYRLSITEDFFFPHHQLVHERTGEILFEQKASAHFLAFNQEVSMAIYRSLRLFSEVSVGDFLWIKADGDLDDKKPAFSFAVGLIKTFDWRQDSQQ